VCHAVDGADHVFGDLSRGWPPRIPPGLRRGVGLGNCAPGPDDRHRRGGASGDFEGEEVNYAESAKYLRLALRQLSGAPDALVVYQLIGLIYERLENYEEAIAIYEEFLRIFPDSSEATAVRSFIVQLQKQKP